MRGGGGVGARCSAAPEARGRSRTPRGKVIKAERGGRGGDGRHLVITPTDRLPTTPAATFPRSQACVVHFPFLPRYRCGLPPRPLFCRAVLLCPGLTPPALCSHRGQDHGVSPPPPIVGGWPPVANRWCPRRAAAARFGGRGGGGHRGRGTYRRRCRGGPPRGFVALVGRPPGLLPYRAPLLWSPVCIASRGGGGGRCRCRCSDRVQVIAATGGDVHRRRRRPPFLLPPLGHRHPVIVPPPPAGTDGGVVRAGRPLLRPPQLPTAARARRGLTAKQRPPRRRPRCARQRQLAVGDPIFWAGPPSRGAGAAGGGRAVHARRGTRAARRPRRRGGPAAGRPHAGHVPIGRRVLCARPPGGDAPAGRRRARARPARGGQLGRAAGGDEPVGGAIFWARAWARGRGGWGGKGGRRGGGVAVGVVAVGGRLVPSGRRVGVRMGAGCALGEGTDARCGWKTMRRSTTCACGARCRGGRS